MDKLTESFIKYFAYLRYGDHLGREEITVSHFNEYLDNLIKNELIMGNIYYEDVLDEVKNCVVNELTKKHQYFIKNEIRDPIILEMLIYDMEQSTISWTTEVLS